MTLTAYTYIRMWFYMYRSSWILSSRQSLGPS
jgi:hypothetical protein